MKVSLCRMGLLAALSGATGCGRAPAPSVYIEAPVARLAPGGAGAAYMTITNATGSDDRLDAVEAPFARVVEMHEVITSGGVARMVARPEGFAIRAGETVELRPGGKHIMFFGAERAEARSSVSLALHFERSGTVLIDARVTSAASGE